MADILFAIPRGFNIKTTTGVLFKGERIPAPLPENILMDIKEKPYRWDLVYEEEQKEKIEKVTKAAKKPILTKNKK